MRVVLVHGTASSPARWAELINELENDPSFRANYEIWIFIYNTGNPIAYSASLLRDGRQSFRMPMQNAFDFLDRFRISLDRVA